MNRRAALARSFRAEQIMSRYRPIAPKPSSSSSSSRSTLPTQAPSNVHYINNNSRVCKKRTGTSKRSRSSGGTPTPSPPSTSSDCAASRPALIPASKPSPFSAYSQDRHQLEQRERPPWKDGLELKTLPLLPDTPAASVSPCESTTSSSSVEPAESLTELSLRFGDSCNSHSHCTSRSRSFALRSGWATESFQKASSTGRNGSQANAQGSFEARLFDQAYVACPEPVALTNEKAGVVWCNPAYRDTVRRSEELGLPVPLYCFGSGAVLWVFWRKFVSPAGLPVCGPMKPLAVRASCENLLANLKQTC